MSDRPDKTVFHDMETCTCGISLSCVEGMIKERRVFDMPEPRSEVTEHVIREKICTCGCRNTGIFPENVKAPVQYGIGVVLLSTHCHPSYQKICALFNDLFDYTINVSTVVSRDVRPRKGKIKIAGAFGTFQGAKEFARIQGCISTFRKQNLNTFKELKKNLSTQNYQTVLNT